MAEFSLSRETTVDAPAERVHALLDDFRAWHAWSPWEDADPDLARTYTGPERGVGARYHWSGNKEAGEGEMVITASEPHHVALDLQFLKPFKAAYVQAFDLAPAGEGTRVVWSMRGHRGALMQALGKLFFDKKIGGDFERGLARLKADAEGGTVAG